MIRSNRRMSASTIAAFVTRPAILRRGVGQPGADREQVLLDHSIAAARSGVEAGSARRAQAGVELVHLAVGVHARIAFDTRGWSKSEVSPASPVFV